MSTPNDGVWWIIASAWKADKNRYDTDAFNRIGIINIYIGEAKLVLTNEASNFSYEDLQKFWMILRSNYGNCLLIKTV